MILKLFRCRVPAATRERFLEAQGHWRRLREVDGFLAQRCGFVEGDPAACAILALWEDRPFLERFMKCEHDRIVESGQQAGTYLEGRVDLAGSFGAAARASHDAVEEFMASHAATLIEFESSSCAAEPESRRQRNLAPRGVDAGERALLWRVLESTTSFIVTDFAPSAFGLGAGGRSEDVRVTHLRWVGGLNPRGSRRIG